jgi:hypothetical protein
MLTRVFFFLCCLAILPAEALPLGGTLTGDTTLSDASYDLSSDLIVPPNVTLTISPGVILNMPAGVNIRVKGSLDVQGTEAQPVQMLGLGGARWGGLSIESPTAPCTIMHLTVRGASHGADPVHFPYAISAVDATITMDGLDVDDSENPVFTRGGSVIVRNSRLHLTITGDGINVNGGHAELRNNTILGNLEPDSDGIDFNGGVNCIVAGNHIFHFLGFNSDAIDIGESAKNILIEDNVIMDNSDKGVSCGQGSTVTVRRNLIVNCGLGIGVKDQGSKANADQNTFVHCDKGVAAYEKNAGSGGGAATVANCIFSKCGTPTSVDALSRLSVRYSLSDTTAMRGAGNLLADPEFVNSEVRNYQLKPSSPAIDAGNPTHVPDPDGSRADMGAMYVYSASDYPFPLKETVAIEEVLAYSGTTAPDWIELHNRTDAPIDISGWFLSNEGTNLAKYRIAPGTVLPADGYMVFYEDTHFGPTSTDAGSLIPFSLTDLINTVYLTSAVNGVPTAYRTQETFGPSLEGETFGNIYRPSSDTWNFEPLATPTPGAANSGPLVGPIVFTEVHYKPRDPAPGGAEFIELMNVSAAPVTLYDADKAAAWHITGGVLFRFPKLTMQPGQRIVLTRDLAEFHANYTVPARTVVLQWNSGHLGSGGEQLNLSRPAGLDALNVRQYALVDSVAYLPRAPWPASPAGRGPSLNKIVEDDYDNDSTNWIAAPPSPGGERLQVPVVNAFTFGITTIGVNFNSAVSAINHPKIFTITGLPAGLVANAHTGVIRGRPTKSGIFLVKVKASNRAGTSATVSAPLVVEALPDDLLGNFTGIVGRDAAANDGLGARLALTTTRTGAYTAKLTHGATTQRFAGFLAPAAPQISASVGGAALLLTLDPVTNLITGTHGGAAVNGWRATWNSANPATNRSGYYSVGIDLLDAGDLGVTGIPQGSGFASFTVAATGRLTVTGRTADGQAIISTGFLGPNGEIAVYRSLYASRGSIVGTLTLDEGAEGSNDDAASGTLTWFKPTDHSRAYAPAFGPINLSVYGRYLAPSAKGFQVLGLPDAGAASLSFTEGGLGLAAINPDVSTFTFSSSNSTLNIVAMPTSANGNPANTTLRINQNTGAILGSFTLMEPSPALVRKVRYQGAIVRPATGSIKAKGYFLLPRVPLAGQNKNTSPILSGGVQITQ